MDSKCFFALCCILLVSFPTEISAIRPKTTRLDSYAKDYPTVASKPVVAAALYTTPGYPATPFQDVYAPRVRDPKQGQGPHHR